MTESPDMKRALREALDPIEAPTSIPATVVKRARTRRTAYNALVSLGAVALIALGATSVMSLRSSDLDPATTEVVPYEQRPLREPDPDQDDWPPLSAEQQALEPIFHDVPTAVKLGDDIRYVVELRNNSDEEASLDPCPAFFSSWGESATAYFEFGYLNCDDAPAAIPAQSSVRFEMVLPLPPDLDGLKMFTGTLGWRLEGSNGSSAHARLDTILRDTAEITVSPGGCREWDGGHLRNRCKEDPKEARSDCPPGIEGEGLEMVEPYPPRPYFESFNLWRAKSRDRPDTCVVIVAGQQQAEADEGETAYEPNGWLMIIGDYRHDEDGLARLEVPLPRPVRIVDASGRAYRSSLVLQSLEDCSLVQYFVVQRKFISSVPFDEDDPPCPPRD